MFRRRRVEDADEPAPGVRQDDNLDEWGGRDQDSSRGTGASVGPWDVTETCPGRERIDLGSLLVPTAQGLDVQLNFAAPKRAGLWDDIRRELIDELNAAGGRGEEAEGPFGPEVRARVPAEPSAGTGSQPARFLGADGPRWFLRGVISGPAAGQPAQAKVLEDVFADTVVVRGEHPMPPRDLLELRLPAEAQRALEEQMAQAPTGGARTDPLNPFARGPEITETR